MDRAAFGTDIATDVKTLAGGDGISSVSVDTSDDWVLMVDVVSTLLTKDGVGIATLFASEDVGGEAV